MATNVKFPSKEKGRKEKLFIISISNVKLPSPYRATVDRHYNQNAEKKGR